MSIDNTFPVEWDTGADQALLGNLDLPDFEILRPGNDDDVTIGNTNVYGRLFQYTKDDDTVAGYYADIVDNKIVFHIHYTQKSKTLFLLKLSNELISYLDIKPDEIRKASYKNIYAFCKKQDPYFPFSPDELTLRFNKILSDSKFLRDNYKQNESTVYGTNIGKLRALLKNPNDQDCIDLIVKINAYVSKMEIEATAVISSIAEEASNPWRNFWAARNESFSRKNLESLYQQMRNMDNAVKTFKNANFKNAKEIIAHVNKYFVARNDDERFLIYYPFINLGKAQRAKLVNLLIVEDSYIRSRASIDSEISNGDIILNLFNFCNEADRLSIMLDMEKSDTLYDLFSLTYFDCYTKLALLLGNTWLKSKEKEKADIINTAIEDGSHIFFNTNLFGPHNHESFDDDTRKITFKVSASVFLSLFKESSRITAAIEQGTDTNRKTFFALKAFNPLDPVVITPIIDITYAGQELKKGQPHLMPACMAYLMFREETTEVAVTLGSITFQVALCFIGVGEVIAAVRAGSIAAGVLGITDISIGVGGVIINSVPEIGQNHPDFVRYYNYFTYVWTACRILGSLTKTLQEKKESLPSEPVENPSVSEEIDWMGRSSKIGSLGGKILSAKQIRRIRGILARDGVDLIVEGDKKGIYKLFKPVGMHKIPSDLFAWMKFESYTGAFNSSTKQLFLTAECTEIVAFHEMAHFNHFKRIGADSYTKLSRLERETEVWLQISANSDKWTKAELNDARRYYNSVREDFNLKPIKK